MKEDKKNTIDIIDEKIGIYAITGFSLLLYILWMSLESAYTLVYLTIIIDLIWYIYSQRLLRIYTESDYAKNYTVNYMVCVCVCASVYIFKIPMWYRNICIFIFSCEGFARTFFVEIRKLIKEAKELDS